MTDQQYQLAVAYLLRHIQPSGRFDYDYNPFTNEVSKEYNFIRHAGTVYALYQAGFNLKACDSAAAGIEKDVIRDGKILTGLIALLAIAGLESIKCHYASDERIAALLKSTADALLQNVNDKNGEVAYCILVGDEPKLEYKPNGRYYPGQMLLALTRILSCNESAGGPFLKTDKYIEIRDITLKVAGFIMERDKALSPQDLAFDQWNAMAFAELGELYFVETDFCDYAKKLAAYIVLSPHVKDIDNLELQKTFTANQLATRVEGLAAVALMKRMPADNAHAIYEICDKLLTVIAKYQYSAEDCKKFKNPAAALGGIKFNEAMPNIRIDTVQHVISAYLATRTLARKLGLKRSNFF